MGSLTSPLELEYHEGHMRSLIELYRGFPCLWDVRRKRYRDRGERDEAFHKLTERFKAEYPEATVRFVKSKIKHMLDCLRREVRRVDESRREAKCAEDVHRPKLWYFDLLQFAADSVLTRRRRIGATRSRDDAHSAGENDDSLLELCASDENEEMRDDTKASDANEVPSEQQGSLSLDEEYRAFGVVVASKLSRMDPDQRIICERLINEAIYRGLRNQLTPTSPTVAGNSEPLNVPSSNSFQGPCCHPNAFPNESHQNFSRTLPIMPPQNPTILKNKK